MAGFGRRERDAHRLRVAHLADHDHVGRLPQGGAQRSREIRRVDADLDLLDHAAVMDVLVLDRIFDGDDVARVAAVDLVDERGERRGLARSGRAADDRQAARERGSCSMPGGRPSVASRGTRAGSTRIAAAARPRSRWTLMRNRARPAMRNDASAIPSVAILLARVRRQPRTATASSISTLSSGPLVEAVHASLDADGGGRAGDQQQIAAAALGQHA